MDGYERQATFTSLRKIDSEKDLLSSSEDSLHSQHFEESSTFSPIRDSPAAYVVIEDCPGTSSLPIREEDFVDFLANPRHRRKSKREFEESCRGIGYKRTLESSRSSIHSTASTVEYLDVESVDQEDHLDGFIPDDAELLQRFNDSTRGMRMERMRMSPVAIASATRPVIKRDKGAIGVEHKCSVCEAMTNGFHFGAVSCAACSAFFRRTVAENRTYECRKEGDLHLNCPINQSLRCYCRACRYQKCINAGMDPAAVQPHRDVIGSKKRKESSSASSPNMNGTVKREMEGETLADHLQMNRDYARSLKGGYSIPSPVEKKISPTAHLLTSQNLLAEQLIALSRTPVIASSSSSSIQSLSLSSPINSSPIQHRQQSHMNGGCSMGMATPSSPRTVGEALRGALRGGGILGVKSAEEHANGLNCIQSMGTVKPPMSDEMPVYEYEEELTPDDMRSDMMGHSSDKREDANSISFHDFDNSSRTNVISSFVDAYEKLRERRRLIYCPPTIKDILGGTHPKPREAIVYDRMKVTMRVEFGLVAELLMNVPIFNTLPLDDQVLLFKNVTCYFNVVEKHYFTMLNGGVQLGRIIHNDLTYIDLNSFNSGNFTNVESDDECMKRLFIDPLRNSLKVIAGAMEKIRMSDLEFCGLIIILLFDPTISGLTDTGRTLVKEGKDKAFKDWFSSYILRGESEEEAARRVGETLLLVPAVQAMAEETKENFHLVRVFQIFEYDDLLDDIFDVKQPEKKKIRREDSKKNMTSTPITPNSSKEEFKME